MLFDITVDGTKFSSRRETMNIMINEDQRQARMVNVKQKMEVPEFSKQVEKKIFQIEDVRRKISDVNSFGREPKRSYSRILYPKK